MLYRITNTQQCSSKYWIGCFTEQQIHNSVPVSIGEDVLQTINTQQCSSKYWGMLYRTTNTQQCSSKYWRGCCTEQQIHNGVLVSIGGDVLPNNKYTTLF